MTADPSRLSGPQRTYHRLSERIRSFMEKQNYSCGDKLPPERTLAETFGVSRSSIREAIKLLTAQGLLVSRQGDGTYVQSADIVPLQSAILAHVEAEGEMFDQIMEFRRVIDPAIARIAAVRCTEEQLDKLKINVCEQFLRFSADEDDGDLDARFHLLLAECTGNPLLVKAEHLVNDSYRKGRAPELRTKEWRNLSLNAHINILKALAAHSPEEACAAVLEHLDTIKSRHLFSITRDE